MKKNILIVEDHELTRFGLKTTFEDVDFVDVIYEAASAEDALEIFKNNPVDVVIMDLGLPNMNGIDATQAIHSLNKDTKIIILTSHNKREEVITCFRNGANAYCSKEIDTKILSEVIEHINYGACWIDPSVAQLVIEELTCKNVLQETNMEKYNFTAREKEILKLLVNGYDNAQMAEILAVSLHTVKAHICNILQKLEVKDRTQAAIKAIKLF